MRRLGDRKIRRAISIPGGPLFHRIKIGNQLEGKEHLADLLKNIAKQVADMFRFSDLRPALRLAAGEWKRIGNLGWEPLAYAFVGSQSWATEESLREFRLSFQLAGIRATEKHGVWIALAESTKNRRLAAQCYLEALYWDSSSNSLAWQNLDPDFPLERASLKGVPADVVNELFSSNDYRRSEEEKLLAISKVRAHLGFPGEATPSLEAKELHIVETVRPEATRREFGESAKNRVTKGAALMGIGLAMLVFPIVLFGQLFAGLAEDSV